MHGPPGSGKSSLLAQLTQECYQTNFYYLPAHLAAALDDPNFINFVLDKKGAAFIVEDCEAILRKREDTNSSGLSALLNLTDGLLGSSLNQKFLLTFNTDVENIDPALFRSGRMKYFKKFDRLTSEQASNLAKMAGLELDAKENFSVAEVFNGKPLGSTLTQKAKLGF